MNSTFKVKPGTLVAYSGERYIVVELQTLDTALCRRISSNETVVLACADLQAADSQELGSAAQPQRPELATIPDDVWKLASSQMEVIRRLHEVGRYKRTREQVREAAATLGKSQQTIYRWLKEFEADETIAIFLPKERADKGGSRLSDEVELVVEEAMKRHLLKREASTLKSVHADVVKECGQRGLQPPGLTLIRRRYLAIPEKVRVAKRQGSKVAKERFTPLRGSFPGADHPLDVIQIDHTPVDLIIVDEVYRKPIGRPTLTIAIDVCTRVLMGFNLWLEAPGAASVGLCLSHAMLAKEAWLSERGIDATWPCYGRPRKIHTDNAKEFRGTVLERACQTYGIDLEQRPRGAANYGGHVERGFRTFMRKAHTLPGTTFSNTRSKYDYDSSGKAIMTLKEFEKWFAIYITKVYHHDFHTGIQNTPLARFQEGLLGTDDKPGIGLPERFVDEERLKLDFLPFIDRTVQQYGVRWDHVHYNSDILRSRICERDPKNINEARTFIFRRDPRDVSVIYFWDPDLKSYHEIPYAYLGRPPASLWEVRAAVREQNARGKNNVDENSIFEGIAEMREIEVNAARDTKSARRNEERRRSVDKKKKNAKKDAPEMKTKPVGPEAKAISEPIDLDEEIIMPFDDIDVG
ncbi:DDE-type integrase/transposase/recombinase [Duganella sp. LX20W]|uniref:DDE-type integrase/transposase/recombinase n=1 Tax=Rugamonas brunnea TaxID=2758569 RepID=A0A7W2EXG6_9BURK|nr:helix-turn-helix domain-containing protein [Rugamonas brunnea]MBA5640360.1 DDE-type integrase/transposase/recombinase [Rugamonas brunnea]